MAIYWHVGYTSDHPGLAQGEMPVGLLSLQEQSRWAAFKSDKRRRDWLLGRWTAKHLVQTMLAESGVSLAMQEIIIESDPDGAPRVSLPDAFMPAIGLSLSHSHSRALCAAVSQVSLSAQNSDGRQGPQLGADIERLERRLPGFAEEYFTDAEIDHVRRSSPPVQEFLVTATWSAKEAVLKALRLGLNADTRAVECILAVPPRYISAWADASNVEMYSQSWNHFNASCAPELISPGRTSAFHGWWRTMDGYVLTLVLWGGVETMTPANTDLLR